jgi:hypothetical protein
MGQQRHQRCALGRSDHCPGPFVGGEQPITQRQRLGSEQILKTRHVVILQYLTAAGN